MKSDLSRLIDDVADIKVNRQAIVGRSHLPDVVKYRYEVIRRAYVELGMSIGEIAKYLNLDRSTIYYALDCNGVDISIKHFVLSNGDYIGLIQQMKAAVQNIDRYGNNHRSSRIRIEISDTMVMEFHGPMLEGTVSRQGVSHKGTALNMKESER